MRRLTESVVSSVNMQEASIVPLVTTSRFTPIITIVASICWR